jgi:hypothetical protein
MVACFPHRESFSVSGHARGSGDVRGIAGRRLRRVADYPASSVEASGQLEILNWMCLVGALAELQRKPRDTEFIDTWIFNSSKCFLIAPPR